MLTYRRENSAVLPLQRRRQRAAAAHRIADVGDGALGRFVFRQFQQDRQRAIERLARAEQRRELLRELHEPFAARRAWA